MVQESSKDGSKTSAKVALDALIDLYRRAIWTDNATVNALGRACADTRSKLACERRRRFLTFRQTLSLLRQREKGSLSLFVPLS